jgi:hypothetical protein
MDGRARFLICSDIHYASELEKQRVNYEINAISSPGQRLLVRFYRRYIWLRNPFGHNHLLERVLKPPFEPDWVVANGDYSCDSAFIGVSDPAALASAKECLGALRGRYSERFSAVYGDHELGKVSLCSGKGGLRLRSFELAQSDLKLEPIWTKRLGHYVLMGITSSLVAMPVFQRETLDEERAQWQEIAREHLSDIEQNFNSLRPNDRVILFCHDPTALPFLAEIPAVRARQSQIERTVIGHLHSPLILRQSKLLSGIPKITFCGPTVLRNTSALSRAKAWRAFNILLCPSLPGLQLTKHGGFYEMELDPQARTPARFQMHSIRW